MLLSERQIRALVADLILEGYKDDQRYLIEKYPDKAQQISALDPRWVSWLMSRFGESPTHTEIHPFEESFTALVEFVEKFQAIMSKWKSPGESGEKFRQSVDALLPNRAWKGKDITPAIISSLTVDEMVTLKGLSERKKQSVEVSQELDIEGDRIGKVGPWNLWVPTSMEKSCKIAGFDPVTREPKTTWCTARTVGSNLFYHYEGRQNEDIVLFYIIKDDPSADNDWLSVGYLNGKPVLDGTRGGLSVNRANDGLNPDTMRGILDDAFDPIMSALEAKADELKGTHPAKEKVRAAGQDLGLLKQMLKGHSEEENKAFINMIMGLSNISPDVIMHLVNIGDMPQLRRLANKDDIRPEVIDVIIDRAAKSPDVVRTASRHPNVSPETIEKLAASSDSYVKMIAAESPKASPETLRRLAQELPSNYVSAVAQNPSTPIDVLIDLSKSSRSGGEVFAGLAQNKNLPSEAVDNILDNLLLAGPRADSMGYVGNVFAARQDLTTQQVAKIYKIFKNSRAMTLTHPALPLDILNAELDSPYKATRAAAHMNPQVSPERLASFLADHRYTAYQHAGVLSNPNVPPDSLRAAYSDESLGKERFDKLALNPSSPLDLLVMLVKKSTPYTRELVTRHPNITVELLKKLSKDRNESVAIAANDELAARQAAAVNEALSRVIRRLLK